MNDAALILMQHTNFECFSLVKTDVNHFNCQMYKAYWQASGELLVFHIQANRFLRGMVRAIVGTLMEVGLGKLTVNNFEEIIQSKDRKQAGRSVPPGGLFLTRVQYKDAIENL
jgi:tRNA pseudouridine38-40 synthase